MEAKNLNGYPDHQAQLSRTGFDMGQEFAFTSSVGMILPIYQDFLNVGESVHFSGDLITRTQPLVTAAMCDIDVYLDWFFVPVSMLFTLFPSKRWLTNDFISDFYSDASHGGDKFPVFDITRYLTGDGTQEWNDAPSVLYPNSPYSDPDFERVYKSQFRLANHLGYNPYAIFHGAGDVKTDYVTMNNPNVFPVFPLAYQAIFQDYYRLPLDNFVRRDVKSFNVDSYYNQVTTAIYDNNKTLFELHYRSRNFDYFTGFKPSPLMSVINSSDGSEDLSLLLNKVDSFLSVWDPSTLDSEGTPDSMSSSTQVGSVLDDNNGNVSTAQLRNMFAIEKLLRVTGRAKKDYDSQVLAHFGFKVPHDVKHDLTHICQQHSILHIGEVISTSDTFDGSNGSALGAIGGKGYGVISSGKPYRFTAPVDGIFMCCYSSAPRQRYFGTFDKQNNIVDRLSLYQPEFDKLGMQPLYEYESAGFRDDPGGRVGWQYRYEQWKRKYNRVSEAFAAPGIYDQVVNNNVSWVNATRPFATAFEYAPGASGIGVQGRGLFVQPTDINQIMIVPYEPTMPDEALNNAPVMFYTDPFIHAFRANVKKVSTMSSFGEPDLNGI